MNAARLDVTSALSALELPRAVRVDERLAKKLLVENGAATPADKRRIHEGIEELTWIAALKPQTIGVPAYCDDVREYLEIAVLSLAVRPGKKAARIVELVHRAIPYPVLLLTAQAEGLALSVAHKRFAQGQPGKTVLDGAVVDVEALPSGLPLLGVSAQPKQHLLAFYQGWQECLEAIAAARITGICALAGDVAAAAARHEALSEHARLAREITALRSRAERQTQLARRVEINLEIHRLQQSLSAARGQL